VVILSGSLQSPGRARSHHALTALSIASIVVLASSTAKVTINRRISDAPMIFSRSGILPLRESGLARSFPKKAPPTGIKRLDESHGDRASMAAARPSPETEDLNHRWTQI